jgi:hypothetical protein
MTLRKGETQVEKLSSLGARGRWIVRSVVSHCLPCRLAEGSVTPEQLHRGASPRRGSPGDQWGLALHHLLSWRVNSSQHHPEVSVTISRMDIMRCLQIVASYPADEQTRTRSLLLELKETRWHHLSRLRSSLRADSKQLISPSRYAFESRHDEMPGASRTPTWLGPL